jgi:hypothetical protein
VFQRNLTQKIEAAGSAKMLAGMCQTAFAHIPEDSYLQILGMLQLLKI